MRHSIIKSIFILITSIVLLHSCNKDTLPNATDDGAGTCAMLVNGKVCESHKMGSFSRVVGLGAVIVHIEKKKETTFEIGGFSGNESLDLFLTKNSIGQFKIDKSFKLNDSDLVSLNTRFVISDISYLLTDTLKSVINIARYDTIVKIISGTFSMDLFNSKGQEVKITEGRFDLRYDQ